MDDERDFYIGSEEYHAILEKCERMLETKIETYFDVFEFVELLDSFIDLGKLNKAFTLVNIAHKQHPNNTEIEYRKARIHVERNDADAALEILKKLIKIDHGNAEYHTAMGVAYTIKNDYVSAVKHFTIANELDPEEEEDNLYNMGVTFINCNQYELALQYLETAHAKFPQNILVIYDLAYCYERLLKFEESIELYKTYIDLDPYSEHAWFNLALIYLRVDKMEEAIQAFDYALAVNDSFATAYFNKANCLTSIDKYEEAIDSYLELLKLEPENIVGLLCLAECYEKINDFENAYNYFHKVTDLSPEYSEGWYGLALISFFDGDIKQAKTLFEKAIELDETNDKYWISYGILLKEINLIQEAINSFKKAIKLNNTEYEAWLQYSQIEYDLNNVNVAKKILLQALKTARHPAVYYTLAAMHANEKDIVKALEYFKIAYKEEPELSSYFFDMCHLPQKTLEQFHSIIFL